MNIKELYWIAGILEGEGCFTIERKKYPAIRIMVSMIDEDVIEKLGKITNIGHICQSSVTSTGKQMYQWQVAAQKDVAALMMTLYPLMSSRRQKRIKELLIIWRSIPYRRQRNCPQGHDMTGNNLRITPQGNRTCTQCAKEYRERKKWNNLLGY